MPLPAEKFDYLHVLEALLALPAPCCSMLSWPFHVPSSNVLKPIMEGYSARFLYLHPLILSQLLAQHPK
jgi:hypothetical protein